MNCQDIQAALWGGEEHDLIRAHLRDCLACQNEREAVRQVTEKLRALDTPAPTRSLKPSPDVIRMTIRRNRRLRWMKKMSYVAAAVVVIVGVGVGTMMQGKKQAASPGPSVQQQGTVDVQVVEGLSEEKKMALTALQRDLQVQTDARAIKKVVLQDFVKDSLAPGSQVSGTVTLSVELQPGAAPGNFTNGQQTGYAIVDLASSGNAVLFFDREYAAKTPEAALNYFFMAQKMRNGHIEYAASTLARQTQWKSEYETVHWRIGDSNPLVYDTEILGTTPNGADAQDYDVALLRKTPEGVTDRQHFNVSVQKGTDGVWRISKYAFYRTRQSTVADVPDGPRLNDGVVKWVTTSGIPAVKVRLASDVVQNGAVNAMFSQYAGSDAKLLKSENVHEPIGDCTLITAERALPNGDTQKEYWLTLFVPESGNNKRVDAYSLVGQVTGSEEEAKNDFLEVAKTWQFQP